MLSRPGVPVPYPRDVIKNNILHVNVKQSFKYLCHSAVVRVNSEAVDEDDVTFLFYVYIIKPHFGKC